MVSGSGFRIESLGIKPARRVDPLGENLEVAKDPQPHRRDEIHRCMHQARPSEMQPNRVNQIDSATAGRCWKQNITTAKKSLGDTSAYI